MKDCFVETLPDYLDQVFSNKNDELFHEVADLRTIYRGQSNIQWSPLPSAFRTKEDFLNEHLYIREYERQLQSQCINKNSMDILVDAQHFGIPTRLLDVTFNPLVALFFACTDSAESKSSNGVVMQFVPTGIFMQNNPTCIAYAEYVRKFKNGIHFPTSQKRALTLAVQRSEYNSLFDAEKIVDKILSNNLNQVFFLPKYSNERIAAQEGAFLLCSTPFVNRPDPGYGNGVFLFPDEIVQDFNNKIAIRYIVPSQSKKLILAQLDVAGINEAKLFPDTEHRVRSIVSTVKRVSQKQEWHK